MLLVFAAFVQLALDQVGIQLLLGPRLHRHGHVHEPGQEGVHLAHLLLYLLGHLSHVMGTGTLPQNRSSFTLPHYQQLLQYRA